MDLSTMARGEIAEQFDMNMQKVLDNISDPNTSAKAKRKLTLEIVFSPDNEREIVSLAASTKVSLAPTSGIETKLALNYDIKTKKTTADEWGNAMKGQMSLDENEEDLPDNVTEFRKSNAQ